MTLLPSVREQLEDAATRRARPAHARSASPGWNPWTGRTALALALVVALAVATAGALSRPRSGGVHGTPPPARALTGTTAARLTQIAYVQTSDAPADLLLSSIRARSLPASGGGYEIVVSFTPRVSFAGSPGGYSASVRGPLGLAREGAFTTPASDARAGVRSVLSVTASNGQRLHPGVYTGTVALEYAEHPALLEDSETVYRPVGSFHVRVP
jgi:hypothetical protein